MQIYTKIKLLPVGIEPGTSRPMLHFHRISEVTLYFLREYFWKPWCHIGTKLATLCNLN